MLFSHVTWEDESFSYYIQFKITVDRENRVYTNRTMARSRFMESRQAFAGLTLDLSMGSAID